MSIFEAGAALRVWAARHNLSASAASAQVNDPSIPGGLLNEAEHLFGELEPPALRAMNSRKVHAVAVNETEGTILMYLQRTFTKKQLDALPTSFHGYAVEYRQGVVGQIGAPPPSGVGSPSHYFDAGRLSCGSSIGLGGSMTAGTLGLLCRVGGALHGLSNNHVIGRCSYAEIDHPVLAPANADINAACLFDPFTIGRYAGSAPLVFGSPGVTDPSSNLDAAMMRIEDEATVSAMQGHAFPTPSIVGTLSDNLLVRKVGRTTGLTTGRVTGKIAGFQPVSSTVPEMQQQFLLFFSEGWIVEGDAGAFSAGGDSGSLVVAQGESGELEAVGLLFAGDGTISLIAPLAPILAHFGATIESSLGI